MKIKTYWHMPSKQKILFFINFFLCGLAKASINIFGYKRLSPYYGHFHRMQVGSTLISKAQLKKILLIRRSIKLAVRYTPWNSTCLAQAMVARFWCHYHHIPYMFFIGYAKASNQPLGKDAHAWVTSGPVAITGGHSLDTYQVVLSYSNINVKGLSHE